MSTPKTTQTASARPENVRKCNRCGEEKPLNQIYAGGNCWSCNAPDVFKKREAERGLIPAFKRTAAPETPTAMLESIGYWKGYKAAQAHADKLAEVLRIIQDSLERLDAYKGLQQLAIEALAAYEEARQ